MAYPECNSSCEACLLQTHKQAQHHRLFDTHFETFHKVWTILSFLYLQQKCWVVCLRLLQVDFSIRWDQISCLLSSGLRDHLQLYKLHFHLINCLTNSWILGLSFDFYYYHFGLKGISQMMKQLKESAMKLKSYESFYF